MQLHLPRKDLPFVPEISRARTVALADDTSVAGRWRRDLAEEDNLKPEFANPEAPPASLSQMAKDPLAARRMVLTRRTEYETVQQQSLTLQPLPEDVADILTRSSAPFVELEVLLQPDDLRVLVFHK